MRIITILAKNELSKLFKTPLAWVMLAILQFLAAMIFYRLLSEFLAQNSLLREQGVTDGIIMAFFQSISIILLIVSPLLTMQTFSEEYRSGTIKLLYSAPLTIKQLVLGKYIGLNLFLIGIVFMFLALPCSLILSAQIDWGQMMAGLLGLILITKTFCAVGLFTSSLTQQPLIAAIASFCILITLWLIQVNGSTSEEVNTLLKMLSLSYHYHHILTGLLDSADILYFVLLIKLFLLLTIWQIDNKRLYP